VRREMSPWMMTFPEELKEKSRMARRMKRARMARKVEKTVQMMDLLLKKRAGTGYPRVGRVFNTLPGRFIRVSRCSPRGGRQRPVLG
jgi:hypothetical protein